MKKIAFNLQKVIKIRKDLWWHVKRNKEKGEMGRRHVPTKLGIKVCSYLSTLLTHFLNIENVLKKNMLKKIFKIFLKNYNIF